MTVLHVRLTQDDAETMAGRIGEEVYERLYSQIPFDDLESHQIRAIEDELFQTVREGLEEELEGLLAGYEVSMVAEA